jgi:Lrp/AsnC family transcriptional regulator for asnA, asnC and gidA
MDKNLQIDEIDSRILELLKQNARMPYLKIAQKLGISNATVHERISKMRNNGIITAFTIELDAKKLGYGITAIVGITLEHPTKNFDQFNKELRKIKEIEHVYHVTGDIDTILLIKVENVDKLKKLLVEKIQCLSNISRINTRIVLDSF